jgi:methyltransferase (TIGR00027 family)
MSRTEADSWDLASSVGATATMVAAARALASGEPDRLIDDPFAEPLVRAVGLDFFIRALDGEIDLEDVDPEFNMRRAAEGMTVRTRWFDKLFADAAAAGVRQAVILADGMDCRGLAHLPAARGAGRAVRQDHRTQRAG